jgi:hypothetical protein
MSGCRRRTVEPVLALKGGPTVNDPRAIAPTRWRRRVPNYVPPAQGTLPHLAVTGEGHRGDIAVGRGTAGRPATTTSAPAPGEAVGGSRSPGSVAGRRSPGANAGAPVSHRSVTALDWMHPSPEIRHHIERLVGSLVSRTPTEPHEADPISYSARRRACFGRQGRRPRRATTSAASYSARWLVWREADVLWAISRQGR